MHLLGFRTCYLFKLTAFSTLQMCNLAEILCDIFAFLGQSAMHECRSRPLLLSTKIMVKTMHFPQPQVVIKRALETVFHSLSNDISLIRVKSLSYDMTPGHNIRIELLQNHRLNLRRKLLYLLTEQ